MIEKAERISDSLQASRTAMKAFLRERYQTVVADYKEILTGAMARKGGLPVLSTLTEVLKDLDAQGAQAINHAMFCAAAVELIEER